MDVEQLKLNARSPQAALREMVARTREAPPELLYFLTTDHDETVRAAAAENPATPLQSAPILQVDDSARVRAALSRKLVRILPQLSGPTQRMALETLTHLCRDVAVEVRSAITHTLVDGAYLPPELARELAKDAAREVAAPVLRFCLSLSDDDLRGLLKSTPNDWAAIEVAHRQPLSNDLATALWESGNLEAAEVMLGNKTVTLATPLLDEATEESAVEVQLQKPLVSRPELTPQQVGRLAEFVDGSLLETLAARVELARPELSDVSRIVRRRLDWAEARKKTPSEDARAKALFAEGRLDDVAVSDAVAWGERNFVCTALALLAHIPYAMADKIIGHQSPKGITALCFKAGISMRTCRLVQIRIARLHPRKALLARGGTDYSLSLADIQWQWEFYGLA